MNKLFNFQIVFRLNDDNVIVFTGKTSKSYYDVVSSCIDTLSISTLDYVIENIVYQPFKEENNEK